MKSVKKSEKEEGSLGPDFEFMAAMVRSAGLRWIVAQYIGGKDQEVVAELSRAGVVGYVPYTKITRQSPRRNRQVTRLRPAMGNYIFVGLPAGKSTETVRACDTIVSVLSNRETFEPVEVRSGQVLTVMERVRSGLKAGKDLDGQGFEVGDSVILVNGAMKDQHGKVRDFSGPNGMVRVDMQIFNGQAVAVVPLDSLSKV